MHRQMPVYILTDCSESMAGEAFEEMTMGIRRLIDELKQNPVALETVTISFISFAGSARQELPLTELIKAHVPRFKLGSGTALGKALDVLLESIDRDLTKTSPLHKGDYKPLCFLLTDGEPTDKWEKSAAKVRSLVDAKKITVIAVACGPDVSTEKLKKVTDIVLSLKLSEKNSFKEFFKWASASIATTSERIDGTKPINLPILPEAALEFVDKESHKPIFNRFIFLHAKCSKTRQFYIIRYKRESETDSFYIPIACHKLEDFDFDGLEGSEEQINVRILSGSLPCPYCNNEIWGVCSCGAVHCLKGRLCVCPWCGTENSYEVCSDLKVGKGAG